MRCGSRAHSLLLSVHSVAALRLHSGASSPDFSLFNSLNSTTPDKERLPCSNMFPVWCHSASHNGALSLRGDTSSCEAETVRFYPAESATSPCSASSGGTIWCPGNRILIEKKKTWLHCLKCTATSCIQLAGRRAFCYWRSNFLRIFFFQNWL